MKNSVTFIICLFALVMLYPACKKSESSNEAPVVDKDSIARDSLVGTYTGRASRKSLDGTSDMSIDDRHIFVEVRGKDSLRVIPDSFNYYFGPKTFRYSASGFYDWGFVAPMYFNATFGPGDSLNLYYRWDQGFGYGFTGTFKGKKN